MARTQAQKCHETQVISIFCMLTACEKHAPKQHSKLQSRMDFRGFRANVSPLAKYIYIHVLAIMTIINANVCGTLYNIYI